MERALRQLLPGARFDSAPGNSRRMSAIRATKNKSTEARLRAWLARSGVRGWRLRPGGLPGKPDFLFPAERVVVFADGCFWHGCPRCGNVPGKNRPYWSAKIAGNAARDVRNTARLQEQGYRVLRLWEHELRENAAECVARLRALLVPEEGETWEGEAWEGEAPGRARLPPSRSWEGEAPAEPEAGAPWQR